MALNLLEKTELWINGIRLEGANLTQIAATVATVLGMAADKVLVVDVREQHITLDILEKDIPTENIIGKQTAILQAVAALEGVTLLPEAYIHSNGILGMICLEGEDPLAMASRVEAMTSEITAKIARRAIVFPTGFELEGEMIEDTNTPYLMAELEKAGFTVSRGAIIRDDEDDMVNKLDDAINRAFGLIISTGGVGAEDKDKSVESVLRLDPQAATPYIVKFKQGTGRHVKDGVRIAVGRVGPSLLVALPGPHDEVQLAAAQLIPALAAGCTKEEIARRIAAVLAEKWLKSGHPHGHHGHKHHN